MTRQQLFTYYHDFQQPQQQYATTVWKDFSLFAKMMTAFKLNSCEDGWDNFQVFVKESLLI